MFGLFKRKNKKSHVDEDALSFNTKEGKINIFATLYYYVQEKLTDRCCLHILRDGKEHFHVANGLNSDEVAKELFIAMNRSNIIRDAVIGAYKLCFVSEKEKEHIKGNAYTIRALNKPFEGMACYYSEQEDYVYRRERKIHVDSVSSLEEFCKKFVKLNEYDSIFIVARIDEHNVLCLSEGNPTDIIDSLRLASANNVAIDHVINELSK